MASLLYILYIKTNPLPLDILFLLFQRKGNKVRHFP